MSVNVRAAGVWVVVVLGVVRAVEAPSAAACSGPICGPAQVSFEDGGVVPSNAPALHVVGPLPAGARTDGGPPGVTLSREDGGLVPFSLQQTQGVFFTPAWLVVPDAGFEPNARYALFVPNGCLGVPGEDRTFAFSTTASAPATPATLGTMRVVDAGVGTAKISGGASCFTSVPAALASFALTPDPDAVPYFGVAQLVLRVNGAIAVQGRYGAVEASGAVRREFAEDYYGLPRVDQFFEPCLAAYNTNIPYGRSYEAWFELQLAGAQAPLARSNTVTFTLSCEGVDAGGQPGTGGDAGSTPMVVDGGAAGNGTGGGCGCQAGAEAMTGLLGVALASLVAAGRSRRRRAR